MLRPAADRVGGPGRRLRGDARRGRRAGRLVAILVFGFPDDARAPRWSSAGCASVVADRAAARAAQPGARAQPARAGRRLRAARAARGGGARDGRRRPGGGALPRRRARPLPGRAARHGGGGARVGVRSWSRRRSAATSPWTATCSASTRSSSCSRRSPRALVVGALRTAESASRLRARGPLAAHDPGGGRRCAAAWPRRSTTAPFRS